MRQRWGREDRVLSRNRNALYRANSRERMMMMMMMMIVSKIPLGTQVVYKIFPLPPIICNKPQFPPTSTPTFTQRRSLPAVPRSSFLIPWGFYWRAAFDGSASFFLSVSPIARG
jgi:hypothetical protein